MVPLSAPLQGLRISKFLVTEEQVLYCLLHDMAAAQKATGTCGNCLESYEPSGSIESTCGAEAAAHVGQVGWTAVKDLVV